MSSPDFNFWMPIDSIEKAQKADGTSIYKVKGIASTADQDTDGEFLKPEGMDPSYFLGQGFINYNHLAKNNPAAIIGEPTLAKITPQGLYVEGELYEDSALAQDVVRLGQVLKKNSKNRRLGFSIEGKVVERDPLNEKIVLKSKITGLAITATPKNPRTFCDILKGEVAFSPFEFEDEDQALLGGASTSRALSKSEVYECIFKSIPDASVPRARELYRSVMDNLTTMHQNATPESVTKALHLLGLAADTLEKGAEDQQLIKAKSAASGMIAKGLPKDEIVKSLLASGFDSDTAEDAFYLSGGKDPQPAAAPVVPPAAPAAPAAAAGTLSKGEGADDNEEEDDDDTKAFKKAQEEEEQLTKSLADAKARKDALNKKLKAKKGVDPDEIKDIVKGATDELSRELSKGMDTKFTSVGVLLKSILEGVTDMKALVGDLDERVGQIERQPVGRKSITKGFVENTFGGTGGGQQQIQKGETNTLSVTRDRQAVLDLLDSKIDYNNMEAPNSQFYAQAMLNFEASGQISKSLVDDLSRKDGIQLIN